jgi:hypothetical protein
MATSTSIHDRALALLGSGVTPAHVAAALGVTESTISQLISEPTFAAQVAELRFAALSKHNERDSSYDTLEDALIERLNDCLPLMVRPMEILKAIQVINAAKRRGQSTPESITQQTTILQLNLPTSIINHYSINAQNMVVQAGDQELVTLQAGTLLKKVKDQQHAIAASETKRIPATLDL